MCALQLEARVEISCPGTQYALYIIFAEFQRKITGEIFQLCSVSCGELVRHM
jgi:hypothetical protein